MYGSNDQEFKPDIVSILLCRGKAFYGHSSCLVMLIVAELCFARSIGNCEVD